MKFIALVFTCLSVTVATRTGINGRCGGTTGITCDTGLYCHVRNPGSCGICKRGLKQGDKCGGGRYNALPCGQGLECRYPAYAVPGQQGTCQPRPSNKAREGEACGGGVQNAKQCDTGLFCQYPRQLPGTTGVCVKNGREGDACGAFTLVPQPPCNTGLVCRLTDPRVPDLGGKCARPGGQEGDNCGAFTFPPQPPCINGLVCRLTNPQIPDLGGKCARQ